MAESSPKRKRAKTWSSEEETMLIQLVKCNEDKLFGEMKGCGVKKINQIKAEEWGKITQALNAYGFYPIFYEISEVDNLFQNVFIC